MPVRTSSSMRRPILSVADEFGGSLHCELPRTRNVDRDVLTESARPNRKYQHAVRQVHGFLDLVRHEQHRLARFAPDSQELELHDLARLRIERCKRLIH
jgi:hypothetical protein